LGSIPVLSAKLNINKTVDNNKFSSYIDLSAIDNWVFGPSQKWFLKKNHP
jgi:hypothetical protein